MLFSMVEDGIPKYVFDGRVKGGGILLPQENTPANPTLAFGDGDTGFYEMVDDSISVAINGVRGYTFTAGHFYVDNDNSYTLRSDGASNVLPTLCPRRNDPNSGIGSAAADQLSLISGGVEGIRITEAAGAITNNLNGRTILPLSNTPATPTLAFGDGDTGFYEGTDDSLRVAISGALKWTIGGEIQGFDSYSPSISSANASGTVPNLRPRKSDSDTGIGSVGSDQLSLIAGGVEGIRITETAGAITNTLNGIVATPTTQNVTGEPSGVIDIVSAMTLVTTIGLIINSFSLADGVEGQEKDIVHVAFGGGGSDLVVTPVNLWNGTTITFDEDHIGMSAKLKFMGGKWAMMGGDAVKA